MMTVKKMLKYELKLVKEQIESDSEIIRSKSDSYNLKWIRNIDFCKNLQILSERSINFSSGGIKNE